MVPQVLHSFRAFRPAAALALGMTFLGAAPALAEGGGSTLRVKVDKVAVGKGDVFAVLCTAETFSGRCPVAQRVPASAESVVISFTGLAPGAYAVKLFQDVDGDGKMKRGGFGEPLEPWAFSNNARGGFGPPGWEDSRVEVGPEVTETAVTLD